MNRILTLSIFLLLTNISCARKEEKAIKLQQIETWNERTQPKPKLLTFIFQPSLNENSEIVIDFEKKYFTFKTIYPFQQEPKPRGENFVEEKPPKPYYSTLSKTQLDELAKILTELKDVDFQKIEGTYTDGISYNFSILTSDNNFKVGYIADDTTENQKKLVEEVLNLLEETNKFPENYPAIGYYRNSL